MIVSHTSKGRRWACRRAKRHRPDELQSTGEAQDALLSYVSLLMSLICSLLSAWCKHVGKLCLEVCASCLTEHFAIRLGTLCDIARRCNRSIPGAMGANFPLPPAMLSLVCFILARQWGPWLPLMSDASTTVGEGSCPAGRTAATVQQAMDVTHNSLGEGSCPSGRTAELSTTRW